MVPAIEAQLRDGTYEDRELKLLSKILRKGDRVLDLGAGLGLTSTTAALFPGVEKVMAFEADPRLMPHLKRMHRENGVDVDLHNEILVPGDVEPDRTFYVSKAFWASSHMAERSKGRKTVAVPTRSLRDLLKEYRPTVISCDIEGGEHELLKDTKLDGVRAIVIELHPKLLGRKRTKEVKNALSSQGFRDFPKEQTNKVRALVRGGPIAALRWKYLGW